MTGFLTEGMSLQEALDGMQICMVSSDGDASSLGFCQLQADLADRGFEARTAAPEGTRGAFNSMSAGALPAMAVAQSAPAMTPSYVQTSAMSMKNG